MSDQAESLRNLVNAPRKYLNTKQTRIITVSSGKGGVGKSNFTVNFALALQLQGFKVLIFDADLGLANIDVLLGITPKFNLYHLLKREKNIEDIIYSGFEGIQFIAGGSGFNDLLSLSEEEVNHFIQEVSKLNGKIDFIFFDTGAGLSKETVKFILAAQETILVTTPEPTAITDAYAIIKMISRMNIQTHFQLVINRTTHVREGKQTAEKISLVAKQFLDVDVPTLGYIEDDSNVSKAVKKQVPFVISFPQTSAAKAIHKLADQFVSGSTKPDMKDGMKGFLNRMMKLLK